MNEMQKVKQDQKLYGVGIMVDGKRVEPSAVTIWREYNTEGEVFVDTKKRIEALEEALLEAKTALEGCHDVVEWPCSGKSKQDLAIVTITRVLAKQELKL